MKKIVNEKVLYEIKSNPTGGKLLQLICLLLILKIIFHFEENPLGAVITISFLLIFILLITEHQTIVYDNRIVFFKKRTLPILSSKYVVFFKDVESLEFENQKIFYPGLFLGTYAAAIKNARLVFHFKDGTFKEVILRGNIKKHIKILQITLEKIG